MLQELLTNIGDLNKAVTAASSLTSLTYAAMTPEQRAIAEQALGFFGYFEGNYSNETEAEKARRIDGALQQFISDWHGENASPFQQFLLLISSFLDAVGIDTGRFGPGETPENSIIPRRQGSPAEFNNPRSSHPRPLRPNERINWSDIVSESELRGVASATGMSMAALQSGLQRSARELETVHPEMRGAVATGIHDLYVNRHMPVTIAEGYRDPARQTELMRQGASRARPGLSFHNHSLAVDVVPLASNGEPTWNGPANQWGVIREVLDNRYGTHSIGSWDKPHHQIFANIRNVVNLPLNADGHRDLSSVRHLIPQRMVAASQSWEAQFQARHGIGSQVAGGHAANDGHDHDSGAPRRVAARPVPVAVRNAVHTALPRSAGSPAEHRFDVADVGSAIGQAFSSARTTIGGIFRL